ncbi:galactitol-1-phosphate 5-dehydrogenase [Collinsella sp. AGMB00827]|uniref:Galactitol-1-phosphate 5-dehydrogenase n=1 Tax=Collinsella ureilytica TaxID=2869515 RepID=A0ABS7MKY7_9ACTN|nr:galactitol-1-phosphate 5-dehydrogenase [Collinsella urealyticum]MBY4797060.1 galactitol-1-phosphate 5-dehydrogenase [Collinsella urealyticum]
MRDYFSPSSYYEGKTMEACRLHAIGDFRYEEIPIPRPVGTQLLARISACGVCGSDIPRIFSLGTSKQRYPLVLGHEFAGEIVAVGEAADAGLIGKQGAFFPCIPCRTCGPCLTADYAMCEDYDYLGSRSDGGFAEYCLIPSAWHFVPSSNPEVPGDVLAMTEPCTVAQHAIRNGSVCAGSSVLIFGAGPIGIMAARWAKIFGASLVVLAEINEEKVEFARTRGLTVINSTKQDIRDAFRALNDENDADVTVEGTGSGAALGQCVECTKTFGTISLMGNPAHDTTVSLSQHSSILRKELTLHGVWNSQFSSASFNEWRFTMEKLDSGEMQVEDLITHRSSLKDLPELCRLIAQHEITICKAMYVQERQDD